MGAAAEAILIQTWRALLSWGWNARCHRGGRLSKARSIVCSVGRNLQVLRTIVVGPTEARHTQIGERPQQEKGRQALAPKRTVPRAMHPIRYDTVTATESQNYRRARTVSDA